MWETTGWGRAWLQGLRPQSYLNVNQQYALVKPHLENCVQCWKDVFWKAEGGWETREHHMDDYQNYLWHMVYKERLRQLGFYSLVKRRLKGNLAYNYFQGNYKAVDPNLSVMLDGKPRGNSHKLQCRRLQWESHRNVFILRVLQLWNKLSRERRIIICGGFHGLATKSCSCPDPVLAAALCQADGWNRQALPVNIFLILSLYFAWCLS